jgi:hypothetical protein
MERSVWTSVQSSACHSAGQKFHVARLTSSQCIIDLDVHKINIASYNHLGFVKFLIFILLFKYNTTLWFKNFFLSDSQSSQCVGERLPARPHRRVRSDVDQGLQQFRNFGNVQSKAHPLALRIRCLVVITLLPNIEVLRISFLFRYVQ